MTQIPDKPAHIQATPHQWQAITQRGNNLLVSASAGSGKTKVLIERIMRYIDEGVDIDRLLVVTFTEAAAKEMKERLRTHLEKSISKTTNPDHQQRYLHQLSLLPNATISTIHSFCMKVIRRYFYLTTMDPVFGLLDDVEGMLMREKVWRSLEDDLLESTSWMSEVMRYFSSDRSDEPFTTLVYRLYDFARSKPYPKSWLASLAQPYRVEGEFGDLSIVKDQFVPMVQRELRQLLDRYDELLKKAEVTGFEPTYTIISSDVQQLQDIVTSFESRNYTVAYELAQQLQFTRWKNPTKKDTDVDTEAVKELQVERDLCKDIWKNTIMPLAFFESPSTQVKQLREMAPMIEHLSEVVLRFYDAFQEEKKQANKIDFSDLEHDTLAILSTMHQGEKIASRHFQEQFVEVLVDEYQDVNRVQEAILTSVCRGNNLFMVGDVKQSIYAFRLADPSLFREKYEQYATSNGGERIILAENFRSRDQVLSFTNLVFRQIMDPELGQIAYDDDAALKTGNDSYSTDDTDKDTELYIIEREGATDSDNDEEDVTLDTPEIHLIATKIREMLQQNFAIMSEESTKEHPKKRPLRYSDIVILAPTKKNNTTIEEIFAQYHIPVLVQKNQNYFRRTEITTMMSALKMIDNPTQDIPLVAVLRSGMFGLDEVALAHLRKGRTHMPFIDACRDFVTAFQLEEVSYYDSYMQEALRDKISHFLELLTKWRDMAYNYPLSELIWTIYLDTNFLVYVHGQSAGSQRSLNLHALYERAKDFEASSFKGLRQFVRFIESMQKRQQDLDEPTMLSDDEDAVRVMTIHASKGLEYPVVFLMDTGKLFNLKDTAQSSIRSDDLGLGLLHNDPIHRISTPTIPYLLTRQLEINKLLSEEMRKLYVALTRAREKLIIIGTLRKGKTVEDYEIAHQHLYLHDDDVLPYTERYPAKTYLEWLLLATLREQDKVPYTKTILTETMIQEATHHWLLQENTPSVTEEDWLTKVETTNIPSLKQMLADLKIPYRHQLASNTASYQSVSEIKRMREEPDIRDLPHLETIEEQTATQYIYLAPELDKPQFLQKTKAVTAAMRGSGLHLLMQKLDFTLPMTYETITKTLQQLVLNGILDREVADVIPLDQVLDFFQTEFGQWLLKHHHFLKREQAFSYVVPANTIFKNLKATEDDLLIHGIIDGYVELDNQIILFDYKTDHVVPTEAGIQAVIKRYQEQLNLYAEALEASHNKPVTRKILCLLSIHTNITLS